jgi:hypothetical protein
MPFLDRLQQVLAKIQTVEMTAETLAAADGKPRVDVGVAFEPQEPPIIREVARDVLSPIGILVGEKAGGITLVSEMNTPDTMTNLLEQEALIRSCGNTVTALRRIAIGAITAGPIARNATGTGATSSATVRAVVDHVNGVAFLNYAPISGSLGAAEVINWTGGASCTTAGASAAYGCRVNPISSSFETITEEFQNDGFAWSIRDAMGNLSFDIDASKMGKWKFAHMGAKGTWGTKAMTTGITQDTGNPPILQDASLKIGSFLPVFSKVGFDKANKVVLRKDGNAPGNTGIRAARIDGCEPKVTITVEHELASVFDFYTSYESLTKHDLRFRLGTVAGKQILFFAGEAQFAETPKPTKLEGIVGLDLVFSLTASAKLQGANGEWEILIL